VGIRPDECRAGPREPLDVQVVADAVTGTGVVDAVFCCEGLQEAVVVGVLEVQLNDVVVHVLEGQGYPDSVHPHPLELQTSHRAGRVLQ
jgi:hypothetical protein